MWGVLGSCSRLLSEIDLCLGSVVENMLMISLETILYFCIYSLLFIYFSNLKYAFAEQLNKEVIIIVTNS